MRTYSQMTECILSYSKILNIAWIIQPIIMNASCMILISM